MLYPRYHEALKSLNALDFDDLLLLTLKLFREHPAVLEKYRERFRYIMVDEYQDTNRVQYEFIKLLAGERKNLCVVGDDDQSIYGWRGADLGNILDFEKDFPGNRDGEARTELPLLRPYPQCGKRGDKEQQEEDGKIPLDRKGRRPKGQFLQGRRHGR